MFTIVVLLLIACLAPFRKALRNYFCLGVFNVRGGGFHRFFNFFLLTWSNSSLAVPFMPPSWTTQVFCPNYDLHFFLVLFLHAFVAEEHNVHFKFGNAVDSNLSQASAYWFQVYVAIISDTVITFCCWDWCLFCRFILRFILMSWKNNWLWS